MVAVGRTDANNSCCRGSGPASASCTSGPAARVRDRRPAQAGRRRRPRAGRCRAALTYRSLEQLAIRDYVTRRRRGAGHRRRQSHDPRRHTDRAGAAAQVVGDTGCPSARPAQRPAAQAGRRRPVRDRRQRDVARCNGNGSSRCARRSRRRSRSIPTTSSRCGAASRPMPRCDSSIASPNMRDIGDPVAAASRAPRPSVNGGSTRMRWSVGEECVLELRGHQVVRRRLRGVGAHRLPPERDVRRRVDDGRDLVVRRARCRERRRTQRSSRPGEAPEVGARRVATRPCERGECRVTDREVVAVTVAAVGRDDDVGSERVDAAGEHGCHVVRVGGGQRSGRGVAVDTGVALVEHARPGRRRASRPPIAARASRTSPSGVEPMSIAGSPSSPRVAQMTTASTPAGRRHEPAPIRARTSRRRGERP